MLILYNPPSSENRKPVMPLSLLALGAAMENDGEYVIVDGNLETAPLNYLSCLIEDTGADILGITVMPGPQLTHAVPLCQKLKTLHPTLKIVWGGYFPSQHDEACLRSGWVDFVVKGYADASFKQLVDAIRGNVDYSTIESLSYVSPKTGDIVSNPPGIVPHPDRLPAFPYHRIQIKKYARKTFMGSRTLAHHSSYGCPFSCSFCAVPSMANRQWLAQSAERAAAAVQFLATRFEANAVEFYDNSFFGDEGRTAEFTERIAPLAIGWWAQARIDTLLQYSNNTWKRMRDSGLKMVFMGAESGSNETLQRMNKGGAAAAEQTLRIADKMKQFGIVPEFSFVLGNPPEPEKDTDESIAFIRKVKRVNPAAEIVCYMYAPVPHHGLLYDLARREGFSFPQTLTEWIEPRWQAFSQRRSAHVPWLKKALIRKVHEFESVLNAYYPSVTNTEIGRGVAEDIEIDGCLALPHWLLSISLGVENPAEGCEVCQSEDERILKWFRTFRSSFRFTLPTFQSNCFHHHAQASSIGRSVDNLSGNECVAFYFDQQLVVQRYLREAERMRPLMGWNPIVPQRTTVGEHMKAGAFRTGVDNFDFELLR